MSLLNGAKTAGESDATKMSALRALMFKFVFVRGICVEGFSPETWRQEDLANLWPRRIQTVGCLTM